MNYIKKYILLMRKALQRKNNEEYTELHHIFPKSLYGENNFVVKLNFREHYIAHKLLWKFFKKRYGWKHQKTRKMAMAFHIMVYGKGDTGRPYEHKNSYLYESARIAACEAKKQKQRLDMKGKSYFGASKETIKQGIEKMRVKKTGLKINYPKDRKSPPCSLEKAKKISESRKRTREKFISMTRQEFENWLSRQNLYTKNGKLNSNVSRAIKWRNENA
jgi:hypothetical protein